MEETVRTAEAVTVHQTGENQPTRQEAKIAETLGVIIGHGMKGIAILKILSIMGLGEGQQTRKVLFPWDTSWISVRRN